MVIIEGLELLRKRENMEQVQWVTGVGGTGGQVSWEVWCLGRHEGCEGQAAMETRTGGLVGAWSLRGWRREAAP